MFISSKNRKPKSQKDDEKQSKPVCKLSSELEETKTCIKGMFQGSPDFAFRELEQLQRFGIFYLKNLIQNRMLMEKVLEPLISLQDEVTPYKLLQNIPVGEVKERKLQMRTM
ncbi:hypothetical protein [Paenibacillus gansuensis]|uniref:Uncharacterized protein n=1 Tax=Paenibacillus gansuensis TaxID=306542 RepID=A0ABW5PDM5_9BACL